MSHGRIPALLIFPCHKYQAHCRIAPDNSGIFVVYNYTHLNKQILLLVAVIILYQHRTWWSKRLRDRILEFS